MLDTVVIMDIVTIIIADITTMVTTTAMGNRHPKF